MSYKWCNVCQKGHVINRHTSTTEANHNNNTGNSSFLHHSTSMRQLSIYYCATDTEIHLISPIHTIFSTFATTPSIYSNMLRIYPIFCSIVSTKMSTDVCQTIHITERKCLLLKNRCWGIGNELCTKFAHSSYTGRHQKRRNEYYACYFRF